MSLELQRHRSLPAVLWTRALAARGHPASEAKQRAKRVEPRPRDTSATAIVRDEPRRRRAAERAIYIRLLRGRER
ncbi:hypothetical protein WME75_27320 [Sorangium sp. So ce1014]|uniref:hypothetical protein n=1 Tax=Sorangium sp. So ce1014 TaxID=3133326 RepID=UPI003F5FF55B